MKRNCFIFAIALILTSLLGAASISLAQKVPKGEKWTQKAAMPVPMAALSTSVVNGKIYVIGGYDLSKGIVYATTFEYDPVRDVWAKKANMREKRGSLGTAVVNGKIYTIFSSI